MEKGIIMQITVIIEDRIINIDGVAYRVNPESVPLKIKRTWKKDVLKVKEKTRKTIERDDKGIEKEVSKKVPYKVVEKQTAQETINLRDVKAIRSVDGKNQVFLKNGKSFFKDDLDMKPFIDLWQDAKDAYESEKQAAEVAEKNKPAPSDDEKIASSGVKALAAALIKKGVISKADILKELAL